VVNSVAAPSCSTAGGAAAASAAMAGLATPGTSRRRMKLAGEGAWGREREGSRELEDEAQAAAAPGHAAAAMWFGSDRVGATSRRAICAGPSSRVCPCAPRGDPLCRGKLDVTDLGVHKCDACKTKIVSPRLADNNAALNFL
jgi:hypothetical protein